MNYISYKEETANANAQYLAWQGIEELIRELAENVQSIVAQMKELDRAAGDLPRDEWVEKELVPLYIRVRRDTERAAEYNARNAVMLLQKVNERLKYALDCKPWDTEGRRAP